MEVSRRGADEDAGAGAGPQKSRESEPRWRDLRRVGVSPRLRAGGGAQTAGSGAATGSVEEALRTRDRLSAKTARSDPALGGAARRGEPAAARYRRAGPGGAGVSRGSRSAEA